MTEGATIDCMSTVFTSIIEGKIPGRFVWADEVCVVFATINPISDGHMLVVPRAEVAKFTDAGDELLAHLIVVAKKIGRACENAFGAPRAVLIIAGFEVEHLHIHVVPAWGEAELTFANARSDVPEIELDEATRRVRESLFALGYGAQIPRSPKSAL